MDMRKLGKRGSVLTDNLIWIILGLLLLVLLLYFTVPTFQKLIKNTLGFTTNNVDAVAQTCNIKCSTMQKQGFCCVKQSVTFDDKIELSLTCSELQPKVSSISCSASFCSDYTCPTA